MSTRPSSFDTRNEPPVVEPILIAAVVLIVFVLAILTLVLVSS